MAPFALASSAGLLSVDPSAAAILDERLYRVIRFGRVDRFVAGPVDAEDEEDTPAWDVVALPAGASGG